MHIALTAVATLHIVVVSSQFLNSFVFSLVAPVGGGTMCIR